MRLGLPSFKILGASWATYRALTERLGDDPEPWATTDDLRDRFERLGPLTVAAATDGNHGRAVARVAALLGFGARIFVPRGIAPARADAIRGEGAEVVVVDGSYDDAVSEAARAECEGCLVISDTAWPGYEQIPRWVVEGYSTIFSEVSGELARQRWPRPDVVAVQIGVGSLAAAAVRHFKRSSGTAIVGVEPLGAACMLASVGAGRLVRIPISHDTVMAGLVAGLPSATAWPLVSRGVDLFVAVDDARALEATRMLRSAGVASGETGAAGLAGLLELHAAGALPAGSSSTMLVVATEGATRSAS